jgi:hypothetical protein
MQQAFRQGRVRVCSVLIESELGLAGARTHKSSFNWRGLIDVRRAQIATKFRSTAKWRCVPFADI